MKTNEVNKENIKALAKLGVDAKDIANIYLQITEEGKDIPKDVFIDNLTDVMKFFQSRNSNINDETKEAIYKEDILEMVKKNNKLFKSITTKNIEPMCKKIDSYYFMNPGYTNILIKKNPNIFSIESEKLDNYAKLYSDYAIKVDNNIVNLFEYAIKQNQKLLETDFENISKEVSQLEESKNSKLFTTDEINNLIN